MAEPAAPDHEALVAYLAARLDEDAALAEREAAEYPPPWRAHQACPNEWEVSSSRSWFVVREDDGGLPRGHAEWIARWDPAAVLADIAAKRAVLAALADAGVTRFSTAHDSGVRIGLETVVRLLVQPYAGRPDFPTEWKINA